MTTIACLGFTRETLPLPTALSPFLPTRAVPAHVGTGPNAPRDMGAAARLVETLALASVRKSTEKLYLAKWNTWVAEREAQGKEAWLQYNPDNPSKPSVVRADGVHGVSFLCTQQSAVDRKGVPCRNPLFPLDIRRLGASNLTLHDSCCGKKDRLSARNVTEESTGQASVDQGPFSQGKQVLSSIVDGGHVMLLGMALSYFLPCRAYEL